MAKALAIRPYDVNDDIKLKLGQQIYTNYTPLVHFKFEFDPNGSPQTYAFNVYGLYRGEWYLLDTITFSAEGPVIIPQSYTYPKIARLALHQVSPAITGTPDDPETGVEYEIVIGRMVDNL